MNHLLVDIFEAFASPLQVIIKCLLIGIIASAPMGPVGILCIQRTMQKGRIYGIVTGAGAALSDIIYALITGFGVSFVMQLVDKPENVFWLKLVGSAMLLIFGIYMLRTHPRAFRARTGNGKGTLLHNFTTAFFLTLSNPLIIFLFIALFNMMTFPIPGFAVFNCLGYVSIVAGAMLWWLGLTYVIDRMRSSFSLRGLMRLNHTIGGIVVACSIIYAAMTLFHLTFF